MKKFIILTVTVFVVLFCLIIPACMNQQEKAKTRAVVDSISTIETSSKTLIEQTWDSIYNEYNTDGKKSIKNEIVQGEVQFLLMGYIWDHKGKHLEMLEAPVYKCLGLAEDKGKYYGLFEYESISYNPKVKAQIVGEIPYDKAKELVEGEKYKIKGEIIDFAYPHNKELWAQMKSDLYSTGCIKLKNCTFEKI